MITTAMIVYNIVLVLVVVLGAPLWLGYIALFPKTRRPFWPKLQKFGIFQQPLWQQLGQMKNRGVPVVWIHAVSVGEFNAIRDVAVAMHRSGHYAIAVSTTTTTGQTLARNALPESVPVFYFPFDLWWVYERLFRHLKPDLVLLTETELWPNLIFYASQAAHVPVVLINGRLSPRSSKSYKYLTPWLMRAMLQGLHQCCMQSEGDAQRMLRLGAPPDRVSVMGNLKFDIDPQINPEQVDHFRRLFDLEPQQTVLVAASTHPGEEVTLVEAYLQLRQEFVDLRLILAPRHPVRTESIRKWLAGQSLPHCVRSELTVESPPDANAAAIVILDTIGELMTVFALSDAVIMGGSFVPTGGHNLLEPLAMKVPVVFGPHMFNFPDISRLVLAYRAGVQVDDAQGLVSTLRAWLTDPSERVEMIEQGQRLLRAHRGARTRLMEVIETTVASHNPR